MRIFLFSLFIAILCLTTAQAFSTTYYVNGTTGDDTWDGLATEWGGTHGPKKTIQAGIDVSSDTDIVSVADGTYTGDGNWDLDFLGKAIVLTSMNGAGVTIVDCDKYSVKEHRGFYFHSGEGQNSILNGFTIKNGKASIDDVGGGGILCSNNSSPLIVKCCILENSVRYGNYPELKGGGGILIVDSSPIISDCKISNNGVGYEWGNGAGIRCVNANLSINNCEISSNAAGYYSEDGYIGGAGGGISCEENSTITVTNSRISDNRSGNWTSGGGGGIYCDDSSDAIIENSIIEGNWTYGTGGGISSNSSLTIIKCQIKGNSSDQGSGGISAGTEGAIAIIDSIIIGNLGGRDYLGGGAGGGMRLANYGGAISINKCIISGNIAGYYGGISCGGTGGVSTITDCIIAGNKVSKGLGGGVGCGDFVTWENCVIAGNFSSDKGGGIYCGSDMTPTFINCTVAGNKASGNGGGFYCKNDINPPPVGPSVINSVFWNDEPNEIYVLAPAYPTFSYCDIQGGVEPVYDGGNNLNADPLFAGGISGTWTSRGIYDSENYCVTFTNTAASWQANELAGKLINPDVAQPLQFYIVSNTANTITIWADWQTIDAGASWVTAGKQYQIYDYHLTNASPCIDTGTNDAPDLPDYDIEGNHRVWFGNTSWTVDMGAYEFGSVPLKIKGMSLTTEGYVELTWDSSVLPGATYTVMYSDEEYSATMSWSVLQAGIPSGGSETSYVDTTAPAGVCRYYKVLDE